MSAGREAACASTTSCGLRRHCSTSTAGKAGTIAGALSSNVRCRSVQSARSTAAGVARASTRSCCRMSKLPGWAMIARRCVAWLPASCCRATAANSCTSGSMLLRLSSCSRAAAAPRGHRHVAPLCFHRLIGCAAHRRQGPALTGRAMPAGVPPHPQCLPLQPPPCWLGCSSKGFGARLQGRMDAIQVWVLSYSQPASAALNGRRGMP